jgi:type IV secretion system protein TrbC
VSTSLAPPRAPMPAHRASRRPLPRVRNWVFAGVAAAATLISAQAFAAGSSMPWEEPLQKILESIEGPVAKIIAVVIIIMTGLALAFGDSTGGTRRLIQIVFGLSIAFAASSFFLSFFSFGGGALI